MKSAICPSCGKRGARERAFPEYAYRECGLPGVRLFGGVSETTCPHCGETSTRIQKEGQLLQVIALVLLTTPKTLSGPEMRYLRKACLLSQAALAELLKKRRETVAEREAKVEPRLPEAEEMWFRLVILNEFTTLLAREGSNHLAPAHMKRLQTFTREFCKKALDTSERMIGRLKLQLYQTGKEWQPLERAA